MGAILLTPGIAASAPAPAIERLELRTWGYHEISPEVYEADPGERIDIDISWFSFVGGEQYNSSHCTTDVTIRAQPGLYSDTEHSRQCSDWGWRVQVPGPGVYIIDAAVTPDGGATATASVEVRVGNPGLGTLGSGSAVIDFGTALLNSGSALLGLPGR